MLNIIKEFINQEYHLEFLGTTGIDLNTFLNNVTDNIENKEKTYDVTLDYDIALTLKQINIVNINCYTNQNESYNNLESIKNLNIKEVTIECVLEDSFINIIKEYSVIAKKYNTVICLVFDELVVNINKNKIEYINNYKEITFDTMLYLANLFKNEKII